MILLLEGSLEVSVSFEEKEIIVDQEVSLYQVKALSRKGIFVDWKALAAQVPGARLTSLYKIHCSVVLPQESIAELDELLEREYHSVRRAPLEKERSIRPTVREARMWR